MIADLLVGFYRLWHGRLKMRGAGWLLRRAAVGIPGLQSYPLDIPDGTRVDLDFRDASAWYWMNLSVGDAYFEEEGLRRAIQALIKENSVVWDVGANAGVLSYVLASSTPPPRELHLFEPNPKVFAIACSGLSRFPFATAHQVGLSNTRAIMRLTIPSGGSTGGTLTVKRTGRTGEGIDVDCLSGDELVFDKGFNVPDIVKIDVEGYEPEVLAGLGQVIATFKPSIFFEHISLTDAEVNALVPEGYSIYSVNDADGSLTEGFDRHAGHNSALIPMQSHTTISE